LRIVGKRAARAICCYYDRSHPWLSLWPRPALVMAHSSGVRKYLSIKLKAKDGDSSKPEMNDSVAF